MNRKFRLTKSEDIICVRNEGQTFVHAAIVLAILPNNRNQNRIAIIAGRSVGGAVQRNLAKRRIRSAFQSLQADVCQGNDLVIIARSPILSVDFKSLLGILKSLLEQAGLLKDKAS